MTEWTPGRRKVRRDLEKPFPGVPPHLRSELLAWCAAFYRDQPGAAARIGIEFRIELGPQRGSEIFARTTVDPAFHLDLIEYLLATYCVDTDEYEGDWESAEHLERLLETGNSVYKINEAGDGLETRTVPEVQQEVQAVVDAATGSPGDHLANAWNEAYSRTADPVKSYSESIKAVEAALAPHVSPQNAKQTLGTMIRDVNSKPSKWKFVLADGSVTGVQMVLHLMRMLWDGQTSRHGGLKPTRGETVDEAQAAVHIAATLVQFGVSGAFSVA